MSSSSDPKFSSSSSALTCVSSRRVGQKLPADADPISATQANTYANPNKYFITEFLKHLLDRDG